MAATLVEFALERANHSFKVIVHNLPTSSQFDWTIGWHKTDWAVLSTNNNFKFIIIAPYIYYKIGQIK